MKPFAHGLHIFHSRVNPEWLPCLCFTTTHLKVAMAGWGDGLKAGAFPPIASIFNVLSRYQWNGMRDHFCPCVLLLLASARICGTTVKRPRFSVWLLYCSSPVSGGRVHGLKATLRTHLCHIVPRSSSSLELGFNWGGWVWISDKHLRESLHQQRKWTKDIWIADLHRTAEAPRKSTVTADANNKFTVLCCTLSTTLLLVLLTSHYIAQN